MPIVDLDRQQGFALIAEMTSTRNLLAYGIRVIRTGAFIETTRDPILTMLSIGVEKLYKLTLGLIALDCDHKWPNAAAMKAWGHKLVSMHQAIMDELRTVLRARASMSAGFSLRSMPIRWFCPSLRRSTCMGGWVSSTTSTNS